MNKLHQTLLRQLRVCGWIYFVVQWSQNQRPREQSSVLFRQKGGTKATSL